MGCFEGDVDMALVAVQCDLFFVDGAQQGIWQQARKQAAARRPFVRWLDRNMDRMNRAVLTDRTLWLPYVHIAAYYRWTMPKVARAAIGDRDSAEYPLRVRVRVRDGVGRGGARSSATNSY
jgi:hypothetical protein